MDYNICLDKDNMGYTAGSATTATGAKVHKPALYKAQTRASVSVLSRGRYNLFPQSFV